MIIVMESVVKYAPNALAPRSFKLEASARWFAARLRPDNGPQNPSFPVLRTLGLCEFVELDGACSQHLALVFRREFFRN